jgi:hypothetical protein
MIASRLSGSPETGSGIQIPGRWRKIQEPVEKYNPLISGHKIMIASRLSGSPETGSGIQIPGPVEKDSGAGGELLWRIFYIIAQGIS